MSQTSNLNTTYIGVHKEKSTVQNNVTVTLTNSLKQTII